MPALIFLLGSVLLNMLRQYLPGILGRVLLAFGIGFVSHTVAMPALLSFVQTKVGGMPSLLVQYFGALGLDVVTTMILSALVAVQSQKLILSKMS